METSFRSTTDWVRQRDNRRKPANPPAAANRRPSRKRRESRLRQATDPRRTEWLDTQESVDGKRVLKHRPCSLHFNSEMRRIERLWSLSDERHLVFASRRRISCLPCFYRWLRLRSLSSMCICPSGPPKIENVTLRRRIKC